MISRYRVAGWLWRISNWITLIARRLDHPESADVKALDCKHCPICGQWYWMEVFHACSNHVDT